MIWNIGLRIPSDVTALKWLFCFLTAVLLSAVAFTMGVVSMALYSLREQMVTLVANDRSFIGSFLIYGAFNTSCACVAAICVLYGAPAASGSGLPVRHSELARCY
jgi:hypothetical protein